jgi:ABC-type uncharacterized transport system permease subunit
MISGISITCFAASYAVVLALEVSRLFFRSRVRWAVMVGFAAAGMLAQTLFLAYRASHAQGSPLSSKEDWYLIAAWVLAGVYLYLTCFHPQKAFGVFLLPLVLGLIGVGALLADAAPFAREPASRVWGAIHGVSLLLATVSVVGGFAAGLMYLHQSYHLKHKRPLRAGLQLPSLEWLRKTNGRAMILALYTLGLGILSGIVLNLVRRGPQSSGVAWNDPAVLSTTGMFAWLLIAVLAGFFYRPAREGHKVAYVTVVSFVFLVLVGIGLLLDSGHGGLRARRGSLGPSPAPRATRYVRLSSLTEQKGQAGKPDAPQFPLCRTPWPHLSQERPWA